GGVDFDFPPETTLAADERVLLVSFDPVSAPALLTGLQTRYNLPAGLRVFGPYQGHLDNSSDEVSLQKPTTPIGVTVPYVLMDWVHYQDDVPWRAGADVYGLPLQRKVATAFGDDPANWIAAPPSAGRLTSTAGNPPVLTTQPQSVTGLSGDNL